MSDSETAEFEWLADMDNQDAGPTSPVLGGATPPFIFVGRGLTLAQFETYVNEFNFGPYPPTFVVLHHTSIPDTQAAKLRAGIWDAGDYGRETLEIYNRRHAKLTAIKNFYQNSYGWDRGPHLFIDDKWVWLMTPMDRMGYHAKAGNGTSKNFSIGVEVVGHYGTVTWPGPVAANVRGAMVILRKRLGIPLKRKKLSGGFSSHRDYNKPSCPGDAITEEYYMDQLADKIAEPAKAPETTRYRVTANYLRIRQEPNTASPIAGLLHFGYEVEIDVIKNEEGGDWAHLADGRGFVFLTYLERITTPSD